jgi:hypothetical protein
MTVINLRTVSVGFHPHHDGLILSTIQLLKSSLLNGGDYSFNQYGSFWAMPYLGIALTVPDNLLLFSMRAMTIFIYFLTGFLTFKIAKILYGSSVAKVSLAILILSRPIGLEPIPWPSSIGMFLTVLITFLMVRVLKIKDSLERNILIVLAGATVVMIILTRAQIGALAFFFIFGYLIATHAKDLIPFLSGMAGFSILYGSWLASLGWLSDSLWDQFVFGWIVAVSGETDRTFPKTSLLILAFLTILFFALRNMQVTGVYTSAYALLAIITWLGLILFAVFSPNSFQIYLGKFWVAVLLIAVISFLFSLRDMLRNQERVAILVGFLALSNASQIFPLFDPMHAWWGITPLVIPLSNLIVKTLLPALSAKLRVYSFIGLCVMMLLPFVLLSSTQRVYPMKTDDLGLIYSSAAQSKSHEIQRQFFTKRIPQGSAVLNLCVDSDVFFNAKLAVSASRYFVYWPTMDGAKRIQKEILNSKPDFVLVCKSNLEVIPQKLQEKFTTFPYRQTGSLNNDKSLQLYALDKGNAN